MSSAARARGWRGSPAWPREGLERRTQYPPFPQVDCYSFFLLRFLEICGYNSAFTARRRAAEHEGGSSIANRPSIASVLSVSDLFSLYPSAVSFAKSFVQRQIEEGRSPCPFQDLQDGWHGVAAWPSSFRLPPLGNPAWALIIVGTDGNTTPPTAAQLSYINGGSSFNYFNNVGMSSTGGASFVYLGDGWCMSAAHVTISNDYPHLAFTQSFDTQSLLTISGNTTFTSVSPNVLVAGVDLQLFHIDQVPDLPQSTIGSATPVRRDHVQFPGDHRRQRRRLANRNQRPSDPRLLEQRLRHLQHGKPGNRLDHAADEGDQPAS